MNILVTGGAGFIGSNFIRFLLKERNDVEVVNFDDLTYAGNLENLTDVEKEFSGRYSFVKGNICDKTSVEEAIKEHSVKAIINFAAETHVDRSILDSEAFIQTNIIGTKVLLDAALNNKIERYVQISTDEVYGSLGAEGAFSEDHQIAPNSPYSASKAASDHLVRAYFKTYGLPGLITRCSNNYGPYQFPEKLIPLLISNCMNDRDLPVYGDGKNVRDWIHVNDHSRAVLAIFEKGIPGEVYNIGGDCEKENLEIVKTVLDSLDKPESLIKFVTDRPGHDRRYAMDFSKIERELGWTPSETFEKGIADTIEWYMQNPGWVDRIQSKEYLAYYEKNYAGR